ncbi:MAG: CHASE3 domain-containing protein, partial [Pacificimonas sp.]
MSGDRKRRAPQRLWGWGLALTALIAALVGVAVLSATAYRQALGTDDERMRAGALYAGSYQTIMAAEAVYDALQDAERGQRGYALTENPVFLDPYNENVSLVAPRLNALEQLTNDNPAQAARVMSLRRIAGLKLTEMADVVQKLDSGRRTEARQEISSGYGRRLMIEIYAVMGELRAEEQRLLTERRDAVEQTEREVTASISELARFGTALLVAAFIATLGLGAMLLRANRATQRERVVEEENEALEEAVAARTRELVASNQRLIAEAEARGSAENRLRQAQRMEAIGQLTGGIAHDFNNMLAVVIGSLDLLKRRSGDDAKIIRLIDNALEGANRAATLTARLLAFSRQQSLKPEVSDLNALVSGLKEFLRRTLNET